MRAIALTRQQARALAGEWYDWFLARHSSSDKDGNRRATKFKTRCGKAVGEKRWEANHPDELWEQEEDLRSAVRPVLADVGETAQFLATKTLVLNNEARGLFLDFLYKDLAAALKRLIRMSEGDYSPDKYRERFPKFEGADTWRDANAVVRADGLRTRSGSGHRRELAVRLPRDGEHFEGPCCCIYHARMRPRRWIKSMVTP